MKRWHWVAIGALVAASLVAERLAHPEHETWWSAIPGFFVLFGFAGCAAIIYLSKWYGRFWVQRGEDYYAGHGDADPHRARTGVEDPGAGSEPGAADRMLAGDPGEGPGAGPGGQPS